MKFMPRPSAPVIPDELKAVSGIERPASKRKSRASNQRGLYAELDAPVIKQFGVLCAEMDRTKRDLLSEALNLLFIKYGKGPIA